MAEINESLYRFWELTDGPRFERLTMELSEKEPGVRSSERYARSGQDQRGIDIISYRHDGFTEVGQCKCWKSFTKTDLKKIVDGFIKEESHWKEKGVRRLIIFVGSIVADNKIQDEIQSYSRLFHSKDIVFEVWDAIKISRKLEVQRAIAEKYCGPEWALRNCGAASKSHEGSRILNESAFFTDAGRRTAAITQETRERFDRDLLDIRENIRIGKIRESFERLEEWRKSVRWSYLDNEQQAKGLKQSLALFISVKEDYETAEVLAKEAKTADPFADFQVTDALLCREDFDQKLRVLGPPHTTQALNVQLGWLIQSGRGQEALDAFNATTLERDALSYARAGLAALLLNDFPTSEALAKEGTRLSPRWFEVRMLNAKIDYLSTLIPHCPLRNHLEWPYPTPVEFRRQDAASLSRLNQAESEFSLLLQIESGGDLQEGLEGWQLACLASHPDRIIEAKALATQLISKPEGHTCAALWTLERKWDVDRSSCIDSLKRVNSFPAIQALAVQLIQINRLADAHQILTESKKLFEEHATIQSWCFLMVQLMVHQGSAETLIEEIIKEAGDSASEELRRLVEETSAKKKGDHKKVFDIRSLQHREDQKPFHLFQACESALDARSFRYIFKHCDELLTHFPTVKALTLTLDGCYWAGEFKKCLELLDHHAAFFSSAELPLSVQRLKTECLRQIGEFKKALQEAEILVSRSDATVNLVTLLEVQVSIGDARAASLTVRKLLLKDDLTTIGLLQIAQSIHSEDSHLAVECWQKAYRKGLKEDAELALAVELAFRFGIEDVLNPLMPGFYAMADKPGSPIRAFPISEVKKILRKGFQSRQKIAKAYEDCQIPVHILVGHLNCTLSDLLHLNPKKARKAEDCYTQPYLLARHAARELVRKPRIEAGTLFADITSIILAAEIQILDQIETAFAPILISAHLPESLNAQIHKTSPHQPLSEEHRQAVIKLVENRSISECPASIEPGNATLASQMGDEWAALVARAEKEKGGMCCFSVPLDHQAVPFAVEDSLAQWLFSSGDLVRVLLSHNLISDHEAATAKDRLGVENRALHKGDELKAGSLLILSGGLAQLLAKAEILKPLTSFFKVTMPSSDLVQIREESEDHQRKLAEVSWLRGLADRIQRGIQKGIYKTRADANHADKGKMAPKTPEEHALFELLACDKGGAKIAWCDDRYVNRFERIGAIPNYGISEVLQALRDHGFTDDQYFQALLTLRSSNVRFLPITSEEIRYHVLRAPITGGRLLETPELLLLKRYFATCCIDKGRLRPPVVINGKVVQGEFIWVMNGLRAIIEVTARLWAQDDLPEAERELKSRWLLHRMFVPPHGVIEALTSEPSDRGFDSVSGALALLLSGGIMLPSVPGIDPNARNFPRPSYYDWIEKELLTPLLPIEPNVIRRIGELEKGFFKELKRRGLGQKEKKIVRVIALKAWLDLPKIVTSNTPLNARQKQMLGLKKGVFTLEAFGKKFKSKEFWSAVHKALHAGKSSVFSSDDRTEFFFQAPSAPSMARRIPVRGGTLRAKAHFTNPLAQILSGSDSDRRALLSRRLDWIDCGKKKKERIIRGLLKKTDPMERIQELWRCSEKSAEGFYRNVQQRLLRNQHVSVDQSIPDEPETLCDYLRFEDPDSVLTAQGIERSRSELLAELGIAESILRLSGLPILLPTEVQEAVKALSEEAWRPVFATLTRKMRSPLSRFHLSYLVASRYPNDKRYLDQGRVLMDNLFTEESRQQWRDFETLLNWTYQKLNTLSSYRSLAASKKLALTWVHTTRIHNVLLFAKVESAKIQLAFRDSPLAGGLDPAPFDKIYFDASNPRFAGYYSVLLRGLGAAFQTFDPDVVESLVREVPWKDEKQGMDGGMMSLIEDASLMTNVLGSFLGVPIVPVLSSALGVEGFNKLLPGDPSSMWKEALSDIRKDPKIDINWISLSCCIGDRPLPPGQARILNALMCQWDLKEAFDRNPNHTRLTLQFFASRAASGIPDKIRDKIERDIWAYLEEVRPLSTEDRDLVRETGIISSSLSVLAVAPGNELLTMFRYHHYFSELIRRWPATARVFRPHIHGWPSQMSLSQQSGRWELELLLRAMK
jgi:hypothetical protein